MRFTGVKIQPPPRLLIHRQHQQDALRHSWDGLVAGTHGSVDEHTEVMGAGRLSDGVEDEGLGPWGLK